MRSDFLINGLIMISAIIMLSGCAPIANLEPGAEKVRVGTGAVPKGCQLRGDVSSSTEFIPTSSHKNVMEAQINSLKNQALKLGANQVVITGHVTDYYSEIIVPTADINRGIDLHAMSGQAYSCRR